MNKEDQIKLVNKTLSELLMLDVDSILPEDNLKKDHGMDSLDAVEIVMTIEKEINVSVSDDVLQHMDTVADIYKMVEENVKS